MWCLLHMLASAGRYLHCIAETDRITIGRMELRRLAKLKLFNPGQFKVGLKPSDFFLRPPQAGLRGHTHRLLQGPSRLRRRSRAFSARVVKYRNRLPARLVLSPSESIFKKQLDRQWSEIFPVVPVLILFSFVDIFLYTVTPEYLRFPFPKSCLCGYHWPLCPFLLVSFSFNILPECFSEVIITLCLGISPPEHSLCYLSKYHGPKRGIDC